MTAEEERSAAAAQLGVQDTEALGIELEGTQRAGEVEVQERWRPTQVEREALARLSALGIDSGDIAGRMGKTETQVKYALKQPGQAELEQAQREDANKYVGFAMAQLQLAAPDSVNNALRIIRDTAHRDNARMTIWHLDTMLAPHIRSPEERHDFTINLSKQAAQVIVEGIIGYREQRPVTDINTSSISHLRQGADAHVASRASLKPTESGDDRIDIDGVKVV